ncbi:methionine aminopeptidase 1D, mitochondrial isoform X2 [Agrilus planipennis]|uniref:Methionine aminopeptidase n=1 Tax=Agrilus planipennis TaxID=224129 RepID=A0A1W4WW54_AGRPL|nr:methionine aminopeptidase 1D, mitochondrial isoform X2 [Agrilus planipennis]
MVHLSFYIYEEEIMIKKSLVRMPLTYSFRKLWLRNFGRYSVVKPGKLSSKKLIPQYILKPCYYETGIPSNGPQYPETKSNEQILKMQRSCVLAANILKYIGSTIYIGQTTDEIDTIAHNLSIINDAYPSPLNYNFFPKSICTSVNNVACHGIPDDRPLEDGDIINVDITVFCDGYHGDCSATFRVGSVDEKGKRLIQATKRSLDVAISMCKPRVRFCEIGACIQKLASEMGYVVVPIFAGHGIGEYFHGAPDIYHIENDYPYTMDVGMTFTIEPILSQGTWEVKILNDNWTAVSVDDSRSAQFEHTIVIEDNGSRILTEPDCTDITKGFSLEDLKNPSLVPIK